MSAVREDQKSTGGVVRGCRAKNLGIWHACISGFIVESCMYMLFPQPFGFVVTRSGKKFCRWRRKANTRASCATCCIPKTRAGCTVPASRVTVAVRPTGPCGGTWAIRTSCLNSQKKKCRTSFAKCKRARRTNKAVCSGRPFARRWSTTSHSAKSFRSRQTSSAQLYLSPSTWHRGGRRA